VCVLIVFACGVFFLRGPNRALSDSGDFATVYSASRCWLAGTNPYLQADIDYQYLFAHGDPARAPNPQTTASVYPPSIFPLVAVVARLDWEQAKRLWLIINLLSFAGSLACFASSSIVPSRNVTLALIVAFLLFSPLHTGIAKGQPSVICISLVVCAFYLQESHRKYLWLGILLGVSCCIKPNIALPYVLFSCWLRQWKAVGVSLVVAAPVSIIALVKLQATAPGWLSAWLNAVHSSAATGGSMDPTIADPISYLLVNFQTVVGYFTINQGLCNLLTYLLVGVLAWRVLRFLRRPLDDSCLLLALLTLLALLSTYHRYYDVQLLMLCVPAGVVFFWKRSAPGMVVAFAIPSVLLWFPLQALASKVVGPVTGSKMGLTGIIQFLAYRNQPLCLTMLAVLFAWAIISQQCQSSEGPKALTIAHPSR